MHATPLSASGPRRILKRCEGLTYVANAPSNSAFLARRRRLVGLALDAYRSAVSELVGRRSEGGAHTEVHDVVPADSTVVDNDVPGPQGDCIPLRSL
jgi:hypothetical protein